MASVWKRLQRVNKRAAKFQYTASYSRIDLETSAKWTPHKLSVVWTRRSRRVVTEPLDWEPSLKDPLKGEVVFAVPENRSVAVTLFKDSRTNELEDKEWTFVLEDVSPGGKRRRLASRAINMRQYASLEPSQKSLTVSLTPLTAKVVKAELSLTLHCVLLREGQATDEDMQSLASLLSVNNNSDIAVLDDLPDDDYTMSDNSTREMYDLRQQMEEMTQSLTSSDIAATPCSVQSLALDSAPTPTAAQPSFENPPSVETTRPEKVDRPDYLANLTKMAKASPNVQTTKPEPKFASTPIKSPFNQTTESTANSEPALKPMVFKQTPLAKYNLKPLDLKINLNSIALDRNQNGKESPEDKDKTPVNELDSLFPGNFDRDKTPVQDLLEWCQTVTADYRQCRVTNLTTSFRSGLALCAIIHHFRPELIDFSGLQPDDHLGCARAALEASAKLGVSPVISASDIAAPQPDKLAIMTYLFQLRAHFTGSELQVEQLGADESESVYLVGRHDTDAALPRDLFNSEISTRRSMRQANPAKADESQSVYLVGRHDTDAALPRDLFNSEISTRRSMRQANPTKRQQSSESAHSDVTPDKPSSPTAIKDLLFQQSKTILGKVLSPNRESRPPVERQASAKWFTDPLDAASINEPPTRPEILMTRKELTDPFGSDEEDETEAPAAKTASDHVNGDDVNTSTNLNNISNGIRESSVSPLRSPAPASPPPADLPRPTPHLLSRHDELKERARQLLEATKREAKEKEKHRLQKAKEKEDEKKDANGGLTNGETSPSKKPMSAEERQAMLRERARKLIADARAGIVSPTSPLSPSRSRPSGGVVEIISKQSVMDEIAAAGGAEQLDALLRESQPSTPHSNRSDLSPEPLVEDAPISDRSGSGSERGRSPLRSFAALVERLTPDKDLANEGTENSGGSYIAGELAALEREQSAIDARAAALEKQLRRVMDTSDSTERKWSRFLPSCIQVADDEEESRLMSQWFHLVNKKNALIRRQMQLNILEQEEDLSRRCELLARELRLSLGAEEWRKTPGQKRRERLLLQELLEAVNERDRLVQEMDGQEKAIEDDDKIERDLSTVEIQRKNNCILQ